MVCKFAKAIGIDQLEGMDWELMSEQITRYVEESMPRDRLLSANNQEESCPTQKSSTEDTVPTASGNPILGDSNPCRYTV